MESHQCDHCGIALPASLPGAVKPLWWRTYSLKERRETMDSKDDGCFCCCFPSKGAHIRFSPSSSPIVGCSEEPQLTNTLSPPLIQR